MMSNKEIISQFYSAFSKGDYQKMISLYHEDVQFEDPAFGKLDAKRVRSMWQMLLSNKSASPEVSFSNIVADEENGSAEWRASYLYGPKKRKVLNNVRAEFSFKEGKIVKHTDSFDVWKWSSQALGPVGSLLGWTSFLRRKIQQIANKKLDEFIEKESS